jgi:hypothetical protein
MADEQNSAPGEYNNSHVTVSDTVGTIVLGILALSLLIALLRSQARNREMAVQLTQLRR